MSFALNLTLELEVASHCVSTLFVPIARVQCGWSACLGASLYVCPSRGHALTKLGHSPRRFGEALGSWYTLLSSSTSPHLFPPVPLSVLSRAALCRLSQFDRHFSSHWTESTSWTLKTRWPLFRRGARYSPLRALQSREDHR